MELQTMALHVAFNS